jgi:arylsulfatase A-like enzyme
LPPGATSLGDEEIDRYDAEIAFADEHIGRVIAALAKAGLSSTTIVAVTSDHGEEFGEHGQRFHARSLFNQVVRVPMIVLNPGSRPTTIDEPVSLADVVPTLLDLAGIDIPDGMSGQSLAAAVRGGSIAPDRPVFLELSPDHQIDRDMVGVVSGDWKAIWDREANAWSLFSLRTDPDDFVDRSHSHPAELRSLRQSLLHALDSELTPAP